eukprot:1188231-Prorocentrum_minimum.AAC.1
MKRSETHRGKKRTFGNTTTGTETRRASKAKLRAGYPNTEPGYPSTEPGYPITESGYLITEPGYPSTEPGYPSTELVIVVSVSPSVESDVPRLWNSIYLSSRIVVFVSSDSRRL